MALSRPDRQIIIPSWRAPAATHTKCTALHGLEVICSERSRAIGERGLVNAICQANEDLGLMPVNLGEVKTMLEKSRAECRGQLLRNIQKAAHHKLIGVPRMRTKRRKDEKRQRQAELIAAQEKQAAAEEQERITKQLAETELKAAKEREMAAETLAAEQQQAAQGLLKRKRQLQAAVVIVLIALGWAIERYSDAKNSKKKVQATLAATDFREAQRYYQSHNTHYALAHLAHAVRLDPEGTSSRTLLVNLLQQKRWFLPVEIFRHEGGVESVQFSTDGTKVVTASGDNTARLWDAATGTPLSEPLRHEGGILRAQFSPDGTKVVTASLDNTARLWDAATGASLGEPLRHEDRVESAQFSPDGTKVVTASGGNTARLWDARTGSPLGEPLRHEGGVWSAQFNQDGTKVVTASLDNTARLWDTGLVIQDNKDLLPVLAEVIGGRQLNELGAIESFKDQIGQLNELRKQTTNAPLEEPTAESFIRWFLSDPWDRPISPLSELTVPDYIHQQIDAGRRDQVEQEFPDHPLLRQQHAKD